MKEVVNIYGVECFFCRKDGASYLRQHEGDMVATHKLCGPHTVPEAVEEKTQKEAHRFYDQWRVKCNVCNKSLNWHHAEELARCFNIMNHYYQYKDG